jgi:hypothetical protein
MTGRIFSAFPWLAIGLKMRSGFWGKVKNPFEKKISG